MASIVALALLSAPEARAEPSSIVQAEVGSLLASIERSGCEFYRNGRWHDAQAAQGHLRDKFRYLSAIDLIDSTEDFIERAATNSSFSGQPYEVRCQGAPTVTSNKWLRDELARLRSHNPAALPPS